MQAETSSEFAELQPAPGLGALLGGVLLRPRALFSRAFGEMTEPGKGWLVVGALILLAAMGAAALNSSAMARLMSNFEPVLAPGTQGGLAKQPQGRYRAGHEQGRNSARTPRSPARGTP